MRVVVVVIAALVTLGLAAFGVVAAQKAAGSTSLVALAARVISPAQSTDAPATPAAPSKVAAVHPVASPVTQISDPPPAPQPRAPAASAAPTLMAQNASTAAAIPSSAPAPTAA